MGTMSHSLTMSGVRFQNAVLLPRPALFFQGEKTHVHLKPLISSWLKSHGLGVLYRDEVPPAPWMILAMVF